MNRTEYEVIQFQSEYHDSLNQFLANVMKKMHGSVFEPDGKDSDVKRIEDVYLSRSGTFLLLTYRDQVVGSIGLRARDDRIAELKRFYVLEEHCGRGLGRELLEKTIRHARDHNFHSVRLDTTSRSTRAIQLFESEGFEYIEKYNDDPYAECYMELELGS